MRKFILITAMVLASATAQAGANRSLILAANDEPAAVEQTKEAPKEAPKAVEAPVATEAAKRSRPNWSLAACGLRLSACGLQRCPCGYPVCSCDSLNRSRASLRYRRIVSSDNVMPSNCKSDTISATVFDRLSAGL